MKKTIIKRALLVAIILAIGFFAIKSEGATILFPWGGGTGLGTATAGDVGKYLRVLDDSPFTYEFATVAGGGDVSKVGTPVDNQIGVWTGDGTIEGDSALTFSTATDLLSTVALNLSGLTASELIATDGSKNLQSLAVATYPSLTELSYGKGVTSSIQTQLDSKLPNSQTTAQFNTALSDNDFATLAGSETLSNKTLTAPKFADLGFIADANGNELQIFDTVASAVNEITFANAATGNNPQFSATGGDTDVGINFLTKAAGMFRFLGNATQAATIRLFEDTDDGTNYTALKVGTQSADITYTLPTAAPTSNGQALTSTTAGVMSWGDRYYVLPVSSSQNNPADGTTVYFGTPVQASGTDSDESQMQIPISGTVVAVYQKVNVGTVLGTAEDVTWAFRLNDTTDTALTSMDYNVQVRKTSTTGLSIAVSAGDAFNIKTVSPTWSTNPTGVRLSAEVVIRY